MRLSRGKGKNKFLLYKFSDKLNRKCTLNIVIITVFLEIITKKVIQ